MQFVGEVVRHLWGEAGPFASGRDVQRMALADEGGLTPDIVANGDLVSSVARDVRTHCPPPLLCFLIEGTRLTVRFENLLPQSIFNALWVSVGRKRVKMAKEFVLWTDRGHESPSSRSSAERERVSAKECTDRRNWSPIPPTTGDGIGKPRAARNGTNVGSPHHSPGHRAPPTSLARPPDFTRSRRESAAQPSHQPRRSEAEPR